MRSFEYSRYAVQKLLSKLLSGDAIISCRRHGAPKGFPPTTLIRLYELLKNDSRSKDRTGKRSEIACLSDKNIGGGERDRTDDPLLAKQVLSQLSYTPECVGGSGWIRTNDPRLIKTVL